MSNADIIIPVDAIAALEHGNKIEAIKITRMQNGLGLKESKDAIEAYLDRNPALNERFKLASSSGGNGMLYVLILGAAALAYLYVTGQL